MWVQHFTLNKYIYRNVSFYRSPFGLVHCQLSIYFQIVILFAYGFGSRYASSRIWFFRSIFIFFLLLTLCGLDVGVHVHGYQMESTLIIAATALFLNCDQLMTIQISNVCRMVHKMDVKSENEQENEMFLSTLWMAFRLLGIEMEWNGFDSMSNRFVLIRSHHINSIRMIPFVFPLLTLLSLWLAIDTYTCECVNRFVNA